MRIYESHTSLKNSLYHQIDTNLNFEKHFHSNFEFVHVYEGNLQIHCEERKYNLVSGQSMLILPEEVHNFVTPNYSKSYICVFSRDFVSAFSGWIANNKVCLEHPLFEKITLDELEEFYNSSDLYLQKSFLYKVCSYASSKGFKKSIIKHDIDIYQQIIDYIGLNYTSNLTLYNLSKDIGYNKKYLSSIFNKIFGCSFTTYINNIRLSHSLKLLTETKKTITQISLECGFGSIRNFNRIFSAKYSCTPTQYKHTKQ